VPGYWGWYCSGVYATLDEATDFITKFGIGTDIHINPTWAISLELCYVIPYATLSDLSYTAFAWGIRYAF
jgi:hypothetical protein